MALSTMLSVVPSAHLTQLWCLRKLRQLVRCPVQTSCSRHVTYNNQYRCIILKLAATSLGRYRITGLAIDVHIPPRFACLISEVDQDNC